MFKTLLETEEAEAARLAEAPEGSKSHYLSTLAVTIKQDARGLVVTLPNDQGHQITVVPYLYETRNNDEKPFDYVENPELRAPIKHDGFWRCIVIDSNHHSYSVGGHDIVVSESEIRRGKRGAVAV